MSNDEIIAFQEKLVAEIESGKPVVIYFDNDGTLFPFVPNPKDVVMDRSCYEGLVRLSQFPNVTLISLTGRDVDVAANDMLTPGYPVEDLHGNILAVENDTSLRFKIIGSHGVEKLDPDPERKRTRYDFSEKFGPEADILINEAKTAVRALPDLFPGIVIEDTKHGSVAVNVANVENVENEADREKALKHVAELMSSFVESPRNPVNPATGQRLFQIRNEKPTEFDIRPIGFGKDFGISKFGDQLGLNVTRVFLCDSLHEHHGTDTPAGRYVNSLRDENGVKNGYVVQVLNGKERSPLADAAVSAPANLGAILTDTATILEVGPARKFLPSSRLLQQLTC